MQATLTPNPGGVGANAYDVQLTRAGQPLDSARLWLTFFYSALGRRSATIPLDAVGGGLYSGAGAELNHVGEWQAWIDVLPGNASPTDAPTRLALRWTVTAQTGSGADRQASVLNALSLLAIVGVLALWLIPVGRRRAQLLQLDPGAVLVGVGALALTAVVFIGGGWYIAQANNAYVQAANPPAGNINPTLADQSSIRYGLTIFSDQCAACHNATSAASGQAPAPESYIGMHNDSDVYDFLRGRLNHPYGQSLSTDDRWALENALRAAANTVAELKPVAP